MYFDFDRNNIREDQQTVLHKNVNLAKEAVDKGKDIVIGAHCCQVGADSYNLALSERRANAIKEEMVKKGIPKERIKTIGYGKELPVVWTDKTERNEIIKELAPNRRGEITAS
jgi:outer membrane protein OmpA-like peptidoglycan-associated protein